MQLTLDFQGLFPPHTPDAAVVAKVLSALESKEDLAATRGLYDASLLRAAARSLPLPVRSRIRVWVEEENALRGDSPPAPYVVVRDESGIRDTVPGLLTAKRLGIDLETTGLDPKRADIRLVQVTSGIGPVVIFDMFELRGCDISPLAALLAGDSEKVGHALKFECSFLQAKGMPLAPPYFDTLIASQVLGAGLWDKHSLKHLAARYLDLKLDKTLQKGDWTLTLIDAEYLYAATDSRIVLPLRAMLKRELSKASLDAVASDEFALVPVVAHIEASGMRLDSESWEALSEEVRAERDRNAETLRSHLGAAKLTLLPGGEGININSPSDLLAALKAMGVPLQKSTSKPAIAPYADRFPVVASLLEYRKSEKAVTAFMDALPQYVDPMTGRMHPTVWQLGAASGRFSCSDPNVQQIPHDKSVRSCFVPDPDCALVIADFSQIELRIMAELSGDRRMTEAYLQGVDIHSLTVSHLTQKPIEAVTKDERRLGKAVNFGLIYGMGHKGLRAYAEINYGVDMTLEEAENFRNGFFDLYEGVHRYHARQENAIHRGAKETRTLLGRRRLWQFKPKLQEFLNAPDQGTSADITKRALLRVYPECTPLEARIIAVVHDEIVLEVPRDRAQEAVVMLRDRMVKAGESLLRTVPVEVEVSVASSWAGKA